MLVGCEMTKVRQGRIFVREAVINRQWRAGQSNSAAGPRACVVIGMIAVPAQTDVERMHTVRVNSNAWIDTDNASRPRTYMRPADIMECDLGHLLTQLQYAQHVLPDQMDLFVRASLLQHEVPHMRWVLVAGVVIGRPPALMRDGLYDLDDSESGVRLVREGMFAGTSLNEILRMPVWGDGGNFGTVTSMEPGTYREWLPKERARNAATEPKFKAFMEAMAKRVPELEVYTAEQHAQREQAANEAIREVMADALAV